MAGVSWIMSYCPVDHTLVMVKKRTGALLIWLTGHQTMPSTLTTYSRSELVFSACKVDTGLAILTASA